ncbi:unnamed protein product [Rotaria sordida]|uniref:G-protein coupled receptors family 1 profile domain-containing protein n=1 Tax=Rotaria sordida TaxID=392033 RepID=A0A815FYI4_9BILA|nr:unnamed protein product [Rotaria sordida]CAF3877279.1 unnamed protein product [Rotaria sordida]
MPNTNAASDSPRNVDEWCAEAALIYIFLFLFAIVIFLAVCGNSILIWIVLAHRRVRTSTNCFLVSIACADILNVIFNIPFNGYYVVTRTQWPFGNLMCPLVQGVFYISIAANIITYIAISLERIWILSLLISSPIVQAFNNSKLHCILEDSKSHEKYEWIFFSMTYIGPILILTIIYRRIAIELWGQTAIEQITQQQQRDSIKSNRKIVKMLIAVVLIFVICCLMSYFFSMSNPMYNPFLYYCMNNGFRNGFRSAFRFCSCVSSPAEFSS